MRNWNSIVLPLVTTTRSESIIACTLSRLIPAVIGNPADISSRKCSYALSLTAKPSFEAWRGSGAFVMGSERESSVGLALSASATSVLPMGTQSCLMWSVCSVAISASRHPKQMRSRSIAIGMPQLCMTLLQIWTPARGGPVVRSVFRGHWLCSCGWAVTPAFLVAVPPDAGLGANRSCRDVNAHVRPAAPLYAARCSGENNGSHCRRGW